MQNGQIVIVKKAQHELNHRPVLLSEIGDGHHIVERLEEQSLPSGKRRVTMLHQSFLETISKERQLQIANTMGLRLERLPYD